MFSKQTLSFFLIAAYCTLVPLTLTGQYYSRNDRLEQRQPNHHSHDYRSDRGDYRDDRYHSRDRDRRYRDNDRYRSRYDRYDRDDCRRDRHYKRHRHRSLFDILIRI
ncbi:MAG: hypothetical protein ABI761_20360 [Saprospiraceae bacterium]